MGLKQLAWVAVAASLSSLAACERPASPSGTISFAADAKPIFDAHCVTCHSVAAEGTAASGVNLSDYAGVMTGTRHGPIVVAGSKESSALYLVVAHKTDPEIHMPPHHRDSPAEGRGLALREADIKTIGAWIDQGALDN